jgi:hypothetical protein
LTEVHVLRQKSPDYRVRLITREEMVDLCLKFARHEEALKVVKEAWAALLSESAAEGDAELKGRSALKGLRVWAELSKGGPVRPEPPELVEWKAADASWRRTQAEARR